MEMMKIIMSIIIIITIIIVLIIIIIMTMIIINRSNLGSSCVDSSSPTFVWHQQWDSLLEQDLGGELDCHCDQHDDGDDCDDRDIIVMMVIVIIDD